MNKKLHFLLFCLLLIFIVYLCKDKLLEPFGNQIVIHPDTAELNPRETTFSILTYDTNLGSGATQLSTCSDDSSWRMGEKTCRDYSLSGSNCEDIGSDGKSAFDACKVACDNCNTYTEVKRRLPSPVEEVDEPSYAQFEGSISAEDTGSDIGSADYREIISRLDDMKDSMGTLDRTVGATSDITQLRLDNMSQELRSSLSGVDSNGDGALTSEEFIQFLTVGADSANVIIISSSKGRIIRAGGETTKRLLEVIRLFKRNSEFTGDKVPDLPEDTIADYAALETEVQRLKGVIEGFNKDNTAPKIIIRDIYKIIVYFARLRLRNNGNATGDSDTYKSKLRVLEEKKLNLLQKLLNIGPPAAAAAAAATAAAAAAVAADPNDNADINIQIGDADNIFNPPGPNEDNFAATPPDQATAYYMNNISIALNEFREILADFKGLLQADVNKASGVILPNTPSSANNPPTTAPQLDVEQIKQNAIAEYKEKLEEEEEEDEKNDVRNGLIVGGVLAVLGGAAYLATQ